VLKIYNACTENVRLDKIFFTGFHIV